MQKTSQLKNKCSKCNAKVGKKCRNTKTGKIRDEVHPERLSKGKTEKKAKKVDPEKQMTPEQKINGELIELRLQEILGSNYPLKFVGPVTQGPVITTYRIKPMKRTKVAHIEQRYADLALALQAESVMVKRIPGEPYVGIYVPNAHRQIINFRDTIAPVIAKAKEHTQDGHQILPLNLGQDSDGKPFVDDLVLQPHLLVAGSTGGGKSTWMHGALTALGYALTPQQLQLVISDTKTVEFPQFKALPHVKTYCASLFETLQAMDALSKETQLRMNNFNVAGVRDIHGYNKKVGANKFPYIVLIIDELADLMGPHVDKDLAKAASNYLGEIVGRSRAAGVYVIAGTQRPDVKMVAGAIKANLPARLSFRLGNAVDSRTILDVKGAEFLMARGDMLYKSSTASELKRLHAPYTSIDDVNMAVQYLVQQYGANAATTVDILSRGGQPSSVGLSGKVQ